ncbi:hypothetical protein ABFS82_13G027400 [Erythranthe guttata]|uniref:Uncharacterized protein n=1 Tax=Erythranthe guttata TaxID=4155 RepID=A0A022QAD2_ERYGU|nr:PREDICTED: uncharacterized protein LOC105972061 [Erythranthe guttata]EYU24911.1 hypothetical protein MIMGU_mgv1a009181mg [Erythranthe guttata]|eukprot:XP_012852449.1 PREDICTED: uncharacterized protein LOC105972061 [Erythranthe guttata]
MGGIMKGGGGHMHSSSSSRRWNVYISIAVLVTVVFGCGVMGIHRIRGKRNILNLLIKEKDDQILSLHLLLQKEREQMQEVIKEREEMKMKVYNLGGQKVELKSKLSEMQSTISSLKDELLTIETAFQEKQNETNDQNHRIETLTETLQNKENEIEDMKQRLQLKSASNHSENGTSKNSEETRGENGRANIVERDEDSEARAKLQAQENPHGENLRVSGKRRSYLRRTNGKRLRVIAKQIPGKRNNKVEERKPIIQLNESVVKDQRLRIDDSIEQGKTKVELRDYIEENNSTKPVARTNSSTALEKAKNENYGKRDNNSSQGEKEVSEKIRDIQMESFEDSDEDRDEPDQF